MTSVLERNIEALLERQRREQRQRGAQERVAEAITRFTGSLRFIYLHAIGVIIWVCINLGITPLRPFDPTFVVLATVASVEAIFLTAFVLMTQNRMQADVDRRADLDLQISLLTEHELTQLAKLVNALAAQAGVAQPENADFQAMQRDVQPDQVLDTLEEKQRQFEDREPGT